jgi:small subunit ribosomal protein S8
MNIHLINLLITLKNASLVKKEKVSVLFTSISYEVVNLLFQEGFVQSFHVKEVKNSSKLIQKEIVIILRYLYDKPVFKNLKIISKPSCVRYASSNDISKLSNKRRVLFVSTNKGITTDSFCKHNKIGGVLLFSL